MIKLDIYRLLKESNVISLDKQIDCRDTPYHIFILETRLYPMIYKMFPNLNIYIYPKSIYNAETYRMDIYLRIVKITKETEENVVLTSEQRNLIQDKINKITSENIDYALIDINELYKSIGIRYPFSWFKSSLQYTGLTSYNSFIKSEGIYLKFDPNSNYKTDYYEVCKFLKDRIAEFYSKGLVAVSYTHLTLPTTPYV